MKKILFFLFLILLCISCSKNKLLSDNQINIDQKIIKEFTECVNLKLKKVFGDGNFIYSPKLDRYIIFYEKEISEQEIEILLKEIEKAEGECKVLIENGGAYE